ncbi:MAG TPA: alanine racemase, partial [Jiangellaceae bacterium]
MPSDQPRGPVPHADVRVDLSAIRDNVRELRARAGQAEVMAVVKGDAYGHGLVPAARAAQAGGASWLGTAVFAEALA